MPPTALENSKRLPELWWPLIATDQGFFAPMFAKSRFPENDCVSLEGSGVGSERQLDPSNLTVRQPHPIGGSVPIAVVPVVNKPVPPIALVGFQNRL